MLAFIQRSQKESMQNDHRSVNACKVYIINLQITKLLLKTTVPLQEVLNNVI